MQETIKIFIKPIKNLDKFSAFSIEIPYHLYIIYIDSDGKKMALAEGPEGRDGSFVDFFRMLSKNLHTTYEIYDKNHPDWDEFNQEPKYSMHQLIVTIKADKEEIQNKIVQMLEMMHKFNAGQYDYKLPTPFSSKKVLGNITHCHNSNTVINIIGKEVLNIDLVQILDDRSTTVPCLDSKLIDTTIDKLMKGDDLTPAEIEELEIAFAISAGTALGGWGALIVGRSAVSKVRGYYKAKKAYEEDAKQSGKAKKGDSKNSSGRGEDGEDGKNGGNGGNDNGNDGFSGGFIGGIGSANNGKARIRADEAVKADEKARIRADDAAEVAVLAEMHEVVTAAIREAIVEVQQLEAELAGTILASADTKVIAEAVQQLKKVA